MLSRLDTIPASDRQTDGHRTTVKTTLSMQSIAQVTSLSADDDKLARRVYRSVKVTKHDTIRYNRKPYL